MTLTNEGGDWIEKAKRRKRYDSTFIYSYDPAPKNNKNQRNKGRNPRQNVKGDLDA